MTIEQFNSLPSEKLYEALERCCGAKYWVEQMVNNAPFSKTEDLFNLADKIWENADESCWLEAFTHHPKIGDLNSLKKKFGNTKKWAAGEQSGVESANKDVLKALAKGNTEYEIKFGYIFIVCATGKSAAEMLDLLNKRLLNSKEEEILVAMKEQQKITNIRLEKLFIVNPVI